MAFRLADVARTIGRARQGLLRAGRQTDANWPIGERGYDRASCAAMTFPSHCTARALEKVAWLGRRRFGTVNLGRDRDRDLRRRERKGRKETKSKTAATAARLQGTRTWRDDWELADVVGAFGLSSAAAASWSPAFDELSNVCVASRDAASAAELARFFAQRRLPMTKSGVHQLLHLLLRCDPRPAAAPAEDRAARPPAEDGSKSAAGSEPAVPRAMALYEAYTERHGWC